MVAILSWEVRWQADRRLPGLCPLVDGRDIATEADSFGLDPRSLVGEAGGLTAQNHLWAVKGKPSRVLVLRCTCGDLGCSPQWVTIAGDNDWVTWDLGETRLKPPLQYDFPRVDYDHALEDMIHDVSWEDASYRLARFAGETFASTERAMQAQTTWEGAVVRANGDVILAIRRGSQVESVLVASPPEESDAAVRRRAARSVNELLTRVGRQATSE